jgi:predicted glycosyltransferase
MKALFDLYHPSHVHLFKNAIWELEADGHEVLITARDKEVTVELLDAYNMEYVIPAAKRPGKIGLVTETATRFGRMVRLTQRYNPDVIAGRINPVSVYTSKLAGASNVMFKDSDYTTKLSNIIHPLVDVMYIPANFDMDLGSIEHRVDAFQELAYLHPNWFEPDPELLSDHGINSDDTYFVLRFVAMDAHHDGGHHGFSTKIKRELISSLEEHGEVFITSEDPLTPEFEEYRLPIPAHLIHHLLSFADLYVGDSQTMATEAALLGTPAIRSNSFAGNDDLSNFVELEETYELLYSFADESKAVSKVTELAADPDADHRWERRRAKLIEQKADVTEDMVDVLLAAGGAS